MAARLVRCANLAKVGGAILRSSQHRHALNGLASNVQKFQSIRGSLVINNSIAKNCLKNFSIATTAMQHVSANDPLSLIQNVDIRTPSSSSSASLSEGSAEDEDEQNCISKVYHPDIIDKVQNEAKFASDTGQVFAVVHIGGRQFKITVNDTITIFKIAADVGDRIKLEKVLLVGGENFTVIGRP
ncbi:50S ribosomal protein L21, chloroplastic, partial [Exaiptasia diaphana]|uniref:Large ribosomal subunit protein bL21m n=1 Tax=Exaiptasia diaphana TaxID=2652724 RepID=A0A913YKC7_EXADI